LQDKQKNIKADLKDKEKQHDSLNKNVNSLKKENEALKARATTTA
jgi:peptidoglycan hydrolase CwlO-like protein